MNRLRQAREYVGFNRYEVAGYLKCNVEFIDAMEAGTVNPNDRAWYRLSKLYQRPVTWLRGEPEDTLQISGEVAETMERANLSDNDRRELVNFVRFLQDKRKVNGTPID